MQDTKDISISWEREWWTTRVVIGSRYSAVDYKYTGTLSMADYPNNEIEIRLDHPMSGRFWRGTIQEFIKEWEVV